MGARKRQVNPQRENVSDIKTDHVAKNRLASSSANYQNTGKKSTAKVTKGKRLNPLIPKKVSLPLHIYIYELVVLITYRSRKNQEYTLKKN